MQCLQVVALNQINHRGVVESGTKHTNIKKNTVVENRCVNQRVNTKRDVEKDEEQKRNKRMNITFRNNKFSRYNIYIYE